MKRGISNALIEGINAKIRLINARGYGLLAKHWPR